MVAKAHKGEKMPLLPGLAASLSSPASRSRWAPPLSDIPPAPKPYNGSDGDDDDDDDAPDGQKRRRRLPQAIAHRGYSAVAPENTIEAFRRAVGAGAHAIETDLRLSKDGVVVLMHDPSLKRTFGENSKVRDHDWSYLSQLRTLRKPHEPMARLVDLLEYLNEPGLERIWVMFDVKRDGDPGEMMQRIAEAVASVPAKKRPWTERILVCCWNASFIKQSQSHMPPGTRLAHVGFSTTYARALLRRVPGLAAISMLRISLATPARGARFIRDLRRGSRRRAPLFVWTVNEEAWMRWAVRQRLDGVITDDPKLFLEVCGRVAEEDAGNEGGVEGRRSGDGDGDGDGEPLVRMVLKGVKLCAQIILVEIIHLIWLIMLFWKHGGPDGEVRKSLEN